jgi:hypothetical protein
MDVSPAPPLPGLALAVPEVPTCALVEDERFVVEVEGLLCVVPDVPTLA